MNSLSSPSLFFVLHPGRVIKCDYVAGCNNVVCHSTWLSRAGKQESLQDIVLVDLYY